MLNFSLDMNWDPSVNRWVISDTNFGEKVGDANNVTEIHSMNLAMSAIIKIFEVLDQPIVATSISVVPGSNTSTILS